jgi:hypothetical protein
VLESLARLPVLEREAILASLSESEAEQLQYDWSFYARPNQLLPPGDWLTWLLLAGGTWLRQDESRRRGREGLGVRADAAHRNRIWTHRHCC